VRALEMLVIGVSSLLQSEVSRDQSFSQAMLIESCRILCAHLIRAMLSFLEIMIDFRAMPKVVANRKINVGEIKRWEALHNFFGRRALLEDGNQRIKRHTRSTRAHDTISIHL
jgi:hypothetical protein